MFDRFAFNHFVKARELDLGFLLHRRPNRRRPVHPPAWKSVPGAKIVFENSFIVAR
jgi:hypothetical protein